MGRGTCECPVLAQFPNKLIFRCRVDKRFVKPSTIERWVVVIYERSARFGEGPAREMITGLIQGCQAVGESITCLAEQSLLTMSQGWLLKTQTLSSDTRTVKGIFPRHVMFCLYLSHH
jgi:hypothetical protein